MLFDAYGTLFDVHSVAVLAEQLFPGFGPRLSVLWRDKQIDYTRLTSMSGQYRPFWDLTRAGLRYAALRLGLTLESGAEDRLMNQYRHLSSFAENRDVLAELKARGIPAGILSNGDPEMLGAAVKSAGFSGLLAHVISVHPLRKFKTDPAAYALGAQIMNVPAKDILFVSSNSWDAIGATWFGYTTLWVNRAGLPPEQLDMEPTRTGTSLRDVLGFFPAAAAVPAAPAATTLNAAATSAANELSALLAVAPIEALLVPAQVPQPVAQAAQPTTAPG